MMLIMFKSSNKNTLDKEIKLIYEAENKLKRMLDNKTNGNYYKYIKTIKQYEYLIKIHRQHVINVFNDYKIMPELMNITKLNMITLC